jgi:hypothetical protein
VATSAQILEFVKESNQVSIAAMEHAHKSYEELVAMKNTIIAKQLDQITAGEDQIAKLIFANDHLHAEMEALRNPPPPPQKLEEESTQPLPEEVLEEGELPPTPPQDLAASAETVPVLHSIYVVPEPVTPGVVEILTPAKLEEPEVLSTVPLDAEEDAESDMATDSAATEPAHEN